MTDRNGGGNDRLAPVTPLFGGGGVVGGTAEPSRRGVSGRESRWHTTWTGEPRGAVDAVEPVESASAARRGSVAVDRPDEVSDARERAERTLLKRLRGRSLSVREARDVLRDFELDESEVESLISAFTDNGYLDDSRLAEQLLDGALGRKAQGATAVAQTLARRGLDREVIDIAMASLPDDEAERALEFARQRARGMDGLEPAVALRRLHGQLARRGFGGSTAMTAARQALDELR